MAEEPEQLGLANKDQAAQDKALDQLTDHVRIKGAINLDHYKASLCVSTIRRSKKKNWMQTKCPQPWLVL